MTSPGLNRGIKRCKPQRVESKSRNMHVRSREKVSSAKTAERARERRYGATNRTVQRCTNVQAVNGARSNGVLQAERETRSGQDDGPKREQDICDDVSGCRTCSAGVTNRNFWFQRDVSKPPHFHLHEYL